jgi:hypothetical protein
MTIRRFSRGIPLAVAGVLNGMSDQAGARGKFYAPGRLGERD